MRPSALPSLLSLFLALAAGCAHAPPISQQAELNNQQCDQKLHENDLDGAEAFCDRALESSPQYADAWVNKGLIALLRNKRGEAKDDFTKAIHYNQDQARAHNDLGILSMQDGNNGEAESRFRRALQINPDYAEAHYNLALNYANAKQYEKAKKELRTMTTAHPKLSDPWHFLGLLRLEEGAHAEALELIKHALKLNPRKPSYWLGLGTAYGRLLRYEDAEYAFQSCLDIDSKEEACQQYLDLLKARTHLPNPPVSPQP